MANAWKWPIMVTFDPDPDYADAMDDVIIIWKPPEGGQDEGDKPQFLSWKELGFEEVIEWILDNAYFPGDLQPVIDRLQARLEQREKDLKQEDRRERHGL